MTKYKVSLSNKEEIFIDQDDYKKIIENINNKFIVVGDQMFNTAFVVSITRDKRFDFISSHSTPKEISQEEVLIERKRNCDKCFGKGFVVKEKDGLDVAFVCECQIIKDLEEKNA